MVTQCVCVFKSLNTVCKNTVACFIYCEKEWWKREGEAEGGRDRGRERQREGEAEGGRVRVEGG